MTQAAHAATAVLHLHRDLPEVKRYLDGDDGKGWETMRKVTMEVCSLVFRLADRAMTACGRRILNGGKQAQLSPVHVRSRMRLL